MIYETAHLRRRDANGNSAGDLVRIAVPRTEEMWFALARFNPRTMIWAVAPLNQAAVDTGLTLITSAALDEQRTVTVLREGQTIEQASFFRGRT